MNRRRFFQTTALASAAALVPGVAAAGPAVVRPPRLRPGDVVGLVAPAGAVRDPQDAQDAVFALEQLGFRPRLAPHALDRHGYLGGTDADRAADLNAMFADPDVRGIVALRGGWGVARLLPYVDFEAARRNPKVVVGYSDITALLLALYARSGFVTFHGPVGISSWNLFSTKHFQRVLMDGEAPVLGNPMFWDGTRAPQHPFETVIPGVARGRLAGGNLTVLSALVGSSYLPDWDGHILFLEDTGEDVYRVDRMLTQLALAGILGRLSGLVFGRCTRCDANDDGFTLMEVLHQHLDPLGIPAWYGSMIGHIRDKFTVPLGTLAEADAATGRIRLLEPAVR